MLWQHLSMERLSVVELVKSESVLSRVISKRRHTIIYRSSTFSSNTWEKPLQSHEVHSPAVKGSRPLLPLWNGRISSEFTPQPGCRGGATHHLPCQHCSTQCQQLQAELVVAEPIVCWVWWLILIWDSGAFQSPQKTFSRSLQAQTNNLLLISQRR